MNLLYLYRRLINFALVTSILMNVYLFVHFSSLDHQHFMPTVNVLRKPGQIDFLTRGRQPANLTRGDGTNSKSGLWTSRNKSIENATNRSIFRLMGQELPAAEALPFDLLSSDIAEWSTYNISKQNTTQFEMNHRRRKKNSSALALNASFNRLYLYDKFFQFRSKISSLDDLAGAVARLLSRPMATNALRCHGTADCNFSSSFEYGPYESKQAREERLARHARALKSFLRFASHQHRIDAHIRSRERWEESGQCQISMMPPTRAGCSPFSNNYTLRNYTERPMVLRMEDGDRSETPCAIGCVSDPKAPIADVAVNQANPCERLLRVTMENTGCDVGSDGGICGNTRRRSDVHMQYFSWELINFMRPPPTWEEKKNFMASFISNCNGGDRLQWLAEMKGFLAGLAIHNYGQCNRDATDDAGIEGSKERIKDVLAQRHKFVFSFENSETEDYITEKLFDMLSSGTLPVYRGATNARVYAPSNKSVVFAGGMTVTSLSNLLQNMTREEYESYFTWKANGTGPDLKWITEIDSSIWHSSCRMCVRAADMDRRSAGGMEKALNETARLWIRERGEFYFRPFNLTRTFDQLRYQISLALSNDPYKPYGAGGVVFLYRVWDSNRCPIRDLETLQSLPNGTELEAVMENPGWRRRKHFVDWWEANGRPDGIHDDNATGPFVHDWFLMDNFTERSMAFKLQDSLPEPLSLI